MAKKKEYKPFNIYVVAAFAVLFVILVSAFLYYVLGAHSDNNFSFPESSYAESSEDIVSTGEYRETMAEADIGDTVSYGNYNGVAVEWIVLDKTEDDIFLVSRCVLDCRVYSEERKNTSYADSDIKNWLCGEFAESIFTDEELSSVIDTENGKVFLLSADEAEKYFASDAYRTAQPNETAQNNGVRTENGKSFWWLRDSGKLESSACYVDVYGAIRDSFAVDCKGIGVRAAIRVSADARREDSVSSEDITETEDASAE